MTTTREDAPEPRDDETPQAYILRVCEYLSEPHRRRLGTQTAAFVADAVQRIEAGEVAPAPIPLVALLAACAQMSIEDMVETDLLREAWSTADDITSRLRYVLNEQKAWWTST